MGMYNEVFKACPGCGENGIMQIPQIEFGFGEYYLDNPDDIIKKLSFAQIEQLVSYVKSRRDFQCHNNDCGYWSFTYESNPPGSNAMEENYEKKMNLLKEILR